MTDQLCKVFIRVVSPDGKVLDAIGTTEQVVLHTETSSGKYRLTHLPGGGLYKKLLPRWWMEPFIDVKSYWIVSHADAPINWKQQTESLPTEHKQLSAGNGT